MMHSIRGLEFFLLSLLYLKDSSKSSNSKYSPNSLDLSNFESANNGSITRRERDLIYLHKLSMSFINQPISFESVGDVELLRYMVPLYKDSCNRSTYSV